jgi:ABC-type oligopeptide transport system ATPase subunit
LSANPRVLILDECLSGLDLPLQAQIVALLKDLQQKLGLTLVFILHDLQLARRVADEIAVMDAGKVVDQGPADRVFSTPAHEHTSALIAAALPRMTVQ